MPTPVLVALVAVAVVLVGLYASWTAQRLDRLHARVDAAAGALDDMLRRRSQFVLVFAGGGHLPRPVADDLCAAVERAAAISGLGHDRELAENAVSRLLETASVQAPTAFSSPVGAQVVDAATRAGFARRFHNDAVRDALVVRRRRIVRLLRLAGRARFPAYFEMDDNALESRRTIET